MSKMTSRPASSARLCVSALQQAVVKQFTGAQGHRPLSQIYVELKMRRVVVFSCTRSVTALAARPRFV